MTPSDLEEYAASQAWKRETRRGRRGTFRKFWAWAVDAGHCPINAAAGLPVVKASDANPRPCPDQGYRVALLAATVRERLMLRLAAEMGMRRAEIAQVHARDFEDEVGGWVLHVHGKGAKERIVPAPPALATQLLDACAGGYAFPGDDHGHLSPRWVGKITGQLLPDGYGIHSLRHRWATRAHNAGVPLLVIQNILGHASPATTRRYIAVPLSAERAAINQLAA